MTDPTDTKTMTDDPRIPSSGETAGSGAPRAPLPARGGATVAVGRVDEAVTQAAPGISVTGLDAFYGAGHAIKDVSIEYVPNKVTAMIGPSGSGKSTVLRCLNRMHEEIPGARAEGRVLLDADDIYGPSVDVVAVRRAIGMVFQKPNPFPTMSIFDNVAAGLKLNGVKGVDLKERFTIVIVTHNMQQAARVSEQTGFFNIAGPGQPGRLIEFNPTKKIFSVPDEEATEAYISGRFG